MNSCSFGGDLDFRQLTFCWIRSPYEASTETFAFLRIIGLSSLILMVSHFFWLSEWKMLCRELLYAPDLFPKEEVFYSEEEIKGNGVFFLDSVFPLCLYIFRWVEYAANQSNASSLMTFFTGKLVPRK